MPVPLPPITLIPNAPGVPGPESNYDIAGDNQLLTQTTWYFDPINGNDNNDGLTSGTPIKTWTRKSDGSLGEYLRRTGTNPYINGIVDWYLMSDMPKSDMISIFGTPGPYFQGRVHGIRTVKRTGTITANQTRSPAFSVIPSYFGGFADYSILSSTTDSPIVITTLNQHGLVEWDIVSIRFHLINTNANGSWPIHIIDGYSFQLLGSTGNGVGGATGQIVVNRRDELQDSAVSDWTSDELLLLEVTTGTTINYQNNIVSGPTRGWVAKHKTAPVRAAMSVMCSRYFTPANPYFLWPGPWPVGSTYTIYTLPKFWGLNIDPKLQNIGINNGYVSFFEFVDFKYDNSHWPPQLGNQESFTYSWSYFDCSFDTAFGFGDVVAGDFYNCLCRNQLYLARPATAVFGLIGPGGFYGCSSSGSTLYGMMMQGPGCQYFGDSNSAGITQNHHASFGFGIYDCDSPINLTGIGNVLSNESSIFGTGITTKVMSLSNGSRYTDVNAYNGERPYIKSVGPSDFTLNGKASIRRVDPDTGLQIAGAPLLCSFDNIFTSRAQGGFEGIVFDPRSPITAIEYAAYPDPPHLISSSPASGSHFGGQAMKIIGWNFVGATSVTIGGVTTTSFVVVNDQLITCVAPALAISVGYNISVFGPGGNDTLLTVYSST